MSNINKVNLCEGFTLHSIKSQKFKTNVVTLYFHVPILKESITKLALLPSVLERGSKSHPTFADISKYMQELYGTSFSCNVRRKGDGAVLFFTLEFVNGKYIGEDITRKVFEFLYDIVFCPVVKDDMFLPEYVAQEKENLARFIEGIINDKREYAAVRCMEEMFEGDSYGIPEYGAIADLPAIDGANLYKQYKDIVNNCMIDVFFSGDFDEEITQDLFVDVFKDKIFPGKLRPAPTKIAKVSNTDVKKVTEDMDVNQSKLCMGLTCDTEPDSDEYYALMLCSNIFGGGPFSKLFNNVRERLSLCYYVGSRVDRLKGIMTISSGIEPAKYQEAFDEIMFQLSEMKNGNITNEEITAAKKYITNGLNSMKDSLFVMEDYYLSQILLNQNLSVDDFLENVMKVTKEQIVAAANKIKLDTIFLVSANIGGEA